jgi:hypothetical protein
MAMPSDVIRTAPFNVLVVLADAGLNVAQILPALKPHYALVCASPAQALDAARQFEPDVVMIDLRVPDARASGTSGSPSTAPSEFQYSLQSPATAGELEQLLWQIGRGLAARTPHAGRPDSEMTADLRLYGAGVARRGGAQNRTTDLRKADPDPTILAGPRLAAGESLPPRMCPGKHASPLAGSGNCTAWRPRGQIPLARRLASDAVTWAARPPESAGA